MVTKYLVLDDKSDYLSIQLVDWDLYNENKDINSNEFLKRMITTNVAQGVIVARENYDAYPSCFEWDVLNYVKFEIHSNFEHGNEKLSITYYLRPLTETIVEGLNLLFGGSNVSFKREEKYENSQEGWQKIFERAIFLNNSFAKLFNNVNNEPYYNCNLWW